VIPFLSREEGQGLIEYALIIVLVAIVAIAILLLLGDVIEDFLNQLIDFVR
jgi:pilus assembly protein Flp/PilA